MEQIFSILELAKSYLRHINWVNFIYLFTFTLFVIYWATIITNWHRRPSSLFEFLLRRALPIPFWILLSYKCFLFIFPSIDLPAYGQEGVVQKIELVNDTGQDLSFNIYKHVGKEWFVAYPMGMVTTPYFDVRKNDTLELSYQFKKHKTNSFYIQMNSKNDSNEVLSFGKAFYLSEIPIRIYASELSLSKSLSPEINYNYELEILVLFFISTLGLWYYFFAPIKKKEKYFALIFALPLTIYGGFMSYFAVVTILS